MISTAAIGDVSSKHKGAEIVVCTAYGYEFGDAPSESMRTSSAVYLLDPSDGHEIWQSPYVADWFWASPVVADVDNDEVNEVIVGAGMVHGNLYVLDGNRGLIEHSWSFNGLLTGPVAIADIDGDENLDIIAAVQDEMVYCWSGSDYEMLEGFPVVIEGYANGGPSVADIDGDFELEIVVGTTNGKVYAINHDGSICSGYPLEVAGGINGNIAIGELDGDGHLEMVFADMFNPYVYCYDLGAGTFPAKMPWRQFQHDSWHSGFYDADNTIPAPPTDLTGEITYTTFGGITDLDWVLSVNDMDHPDPEEPTDVLGYRIYRRFNNQPVYGLIGKVRGGISSFTDSFTILGKAVLYVVTATDGTNESAPSNRVKLPTRSGVLISHGCSVQEVVLAARSSISRIDTVIETAPISGAAEYAAVPSEGEHAPVPTVQQSLISGNPGCLTDCDLDTPYTPSPGTNAVIIDLGEECSIAAVITEESFETAAIMDTDWSIELAGDDNLFELMPAGSMSDIEGIRYVKVYDAAGMTEISIYGQRPGLELLEQVEIHCSSSSEGWLIPVPDLESGSPVEVRVFDLAGRLLWADMAEPSSEVYWNGRSGSGIRVPDGLYLVQYVSGMSISTGRLIVSGE